METMHIQSPEEMSSVAEKMLSLCVEDNRDGATVFALHGDLGAGKTTFVQALAKVLGTEESVTSPTFVIMKGYELEAQGGKMALPFSRLVHIDAYRIENIDEMRVLGFEALLKEKDTIICIEWAENIASLLPKGVIHIDIHIEETGRKITIR